jgi:hypothetical protein
MIVIPALLGLLLCLYNASGAEIFCATDGCAVYASYSLFGMSFYVLGAIGFAALLLLALFSGRSREARSLLYVTILIGLTLDMALLVWQLLFWPCSSCLVVALLLGATAGGFLLRFRSMRLWLLKAALFCWFLLLIPAVVSVGKEVLIAPWMIYGSPEADIQVFFSPTCPACSIEVKKLLKSPDLERMAFYPIAKHEKDVRLLAQLLESGPVDVQGLEKLFSAEADPQVATPSGLRWGLTKNRMILARLGVQTIPFILSPSVIRPAPRPQDLFAPPSFPGTPAPQGCGILSTSGDDCD